MRYRADIFLINFNNLFIVLKRRGLDSYGSLNALPGGYFPDLIFNYFYSAQTARP